MNGARLTVELIARQGIQTIAGIPGGANLPLYDALNENGRIRHVLARHEQGAGFIAQGMARSTGQPAVCFATSGPGATNLVTAMADAKLDSIPVIGVTGQVPSSLIGTDAFQEIDTYGLSIPICKHSYALRSAEELLEVIPEAFRIATSGRPGPVWIDIPKDVQLEEVEFDRWPVLGKRDNPTPLRADPIRLAAEMINQSQRPILCLGGGAIHSNAGDVARRLAEKAGIPTTMTLMGLGAIPASHPLSLGMLGMHAAQYANRALEECDRFIAAGSRFDDRATGKVAEFCPNAKILHIDIDQSEMHKICNANIAIIGDAREALEAILPHVKTRSKSVWVGRVKQLKKEFPLLTPGQDDPLSPYGIIHAVAKRLDGKTFITTDVGQHQMWMAQAYPIETPRQWLTSGGLGTMGFGLPSAIGAALANPKSRVVCFTGDGSLMMNIQELATLTEENLNVKIILMNNNALGLVRQQQDLFYGQRIYAADYQYQADFVQIAKGFGIPQIDLSDATDHEKRLDEALENPGPCFVHVPIDAQEKVYPMVPPGAANKDMIDQPGKKKSAA